MDEMKKMTWTAKKKEGRFRQTAGSPLYVKTVIVETEVSANKYDAIYE